MIKTVIQNLENYIENCLKWIVKPNSEEKSEKCMNIEIISKKCEKSNNNLYLEIDLEKDLSEFDQEKIGQSLSNLLLSLESFSGKIHVFTKLNIDMSLVFNGLILSYWYLDLYKKNTLSKIDCSIELKDSERENLSKILKTTKAVLVSRYLSLMAANDLNIETYKTFIEELFKNSDVSLEILDYETLKKKNLNLICAVGQAGEHLPKIIVLKKGKNPKLALVGKGIMYDTGGLSLKPTDNMMEMYYDMTGSAVVVGTFFGMIEKDIECYGVLALAENSIDSKSYRPGDIFSTAIGKTVEIGNTDAEGRLILADACYYIAKEKNVEEIICLATLTGAARVALGSEYTALMTSQDSSKLKESWTSTGDKIHGLPFDDSYIKYLKSSRADLNNISSGGAGTITAWKFIETLIPNSVKFYGIDLAASLEKKDLKRSEIISNCLCVRSLLYYVNHFTK